MRGICVIYWNKWSAFTFRGVWMRRVRLPNDRDRTLMEQSWIMNLNWTEIKAGLRDCDSRRVFRQVETTACRVALRGLRDPWVQWYLFWLCCRIDYDAHTHTPISMTGKQDTHSHGNDQGCYLYSNEGWSESKADTSGSSRAQRGDPAAVPAAPLQ